MADYSWGDPIEYQGTVPESDIKIPGNPQNNISVRQNNPFNIKGLYHGAIGTGTRGFAIYETPEAGIKAGITQLKLDQSRKLPFNVFAEKYAPAYENPTWAADVAKSLGILMDAPINTIPLDKLAKAVAWRESQTKIPDRFFNDMSEQRMSKVASPVSKDKFVEWGDPVEWGESVEAEVKNPFEAPESTAGGPITGTPSLAATPTPLYEMGNENLLEAGHLDPETMKQSVLNPPNMGYRPDIAKPILQATGLAAGGLIGGAAGAPLGPAGVGAGALAGGTLGYGMANKVGDALNTYMGGKPAPSIQESLIKTATEDIPTGALVAGLGEIGGPLVAGAAKVAGKVIKPFMGRMSGVGEGAIEEALKGSPSFLNALRGKISGEEVVQNAHSALQTIKDARATAYQAKLSNIKGIKDPATNEMVELDIKPIQDKLVDLMRKFSVKITPDGKIDTSRIAMGKKGRNDIEDIIETVNTWGSKSEDKTALGLDTLKRQLDDFYSESSQARAFVTNLRNEVKNTITKQVPEYAEMTKGYSEATKLIKDIEANLMMRKQGMSGRIVADQTLRRLISSMRDNFPLRRELVESLGTKSGEEISAMVAGHAMSPILGRGLSGNMMVGEAIIAHLFKPEFYPILVASSPRLQGEFLHLFGKGLKEVSGVSLPLSKSFAVMMDKYRKENP